MRKSFIVLITLLSIPLIGYGFGTGDSTFGSNNGGSGGGGGSNGVTLAAIQTTLATNGPTANTLYISSTWGVSGSPGTNSKSPMDFNTLVYGTHYGIDPTNKVRLVFDPGTYPLPIATPLILSNNTWNLGYDVNFIGQQGDTNTPTNGGMIMIAGDVDLRGGHLKTQETNGNYYPLYFNTAIMPSNSTVIIDGVWTEGISDCMGITAFSFNIWTQRVNIAINNCFLSSYFDTVMFLGGGTTGGDGTNSIISCANNAILIDERAVPAIYNAVLSTTSTPHGYEFTFGNNTVSGGSITMFATNGNNHYGISEGVTRANGRVTIGAAPAQYLFNTNTVPLMWTIAPLVNLAEIHVSGHVYADKTVKLANANTIVDYGGWATNQMPNINLTGGVLTSVDGTNYIITTNFVSTSGATFPRPIVQAGTTNVSASTGVTVNFGYTMPTTNYTVAFLGMGAALASPQVTVKTTTSFTITMTIFTGNLDWLITQQTQ